MYGKTPGVLAFKLYIIGNPRRYGKQQSEISLPEWKFLRWLLRGGWRGKPLSPSRKLSLSFTSDLGSAGAQFPPIS